LRGKTCLGDYFLDNFKSLNELNLRGNSLTFILPEIGLHLPNLEILDLSHNQLSDISREEIGLRLLLLLPSFPKKIFSLNIWLLESLKKLRFLNLKGNKFRILPTVLLKLNNLEECNVTQNFLEEMPSSLGQLSLLLSSLNITTCFLPN